MINSLLSLFLGRFFHIHSSFRSFFLNKFNSKWKKKTVKLPLRIHRREHIQKSYHHIQQWSYRIIQMSATINHLHQPFDHSFTVLIFVCEPFISGSVCIAWNQFIIGARLPSCQPPCVCMQCAQVRGIDSSHSWLYKYSCNKTHWNVPSC